jgi:hydroxyacylglutathione hydrolase
MYIEQLYTGCLSEAAYYVESNGEAAVIDPLRETAPYLALAKQRGAKIKYIFESHFHADFVSGHIDLAALTGATIIYGPDARPQYSAHIAHDGEVFPLGEISFKVLHTPGHTLESSCYLLRDAAGNDHAIFTGDTLFVGAVGRPDLAVKSENPVTPEELASKMYDSLQSKIMLLADEVIVYPGHGAGSSCGKGIGKETFSTIGVQKASNYALQPMSRADFIAEITRDLPPPPPYYFEDALINMTGYDQIDEVLRRNDKALSPAAFKAEQSAGALVLDTRHPDAFGAGFIPGAWNIGLNGQFAIWVGTLINIRQPLILVADPGQEQEAILRLARVGYEQVRGFLDGGFAAWKQVAYPMDSVDTVTPDAAADLADKGLMVLDVRNADEFAQGHVKFAENIPLAKLPNKDAERFDEDEEFVLHCKSGYRSMIAASILKSKGVHGFVNVSGGYDALLKTHASIQSSVVVG